MNDYYYYCYYYMLLLRNISLSDLLAIVIGTTPLAKR